jgi:glycosyltransferase involved in cell wall biosynthesis
MKVALVTSIYPFVLGGARNIVDWLAKELVERGHEVEVFTIPEYDLPDLVLLQSYNMRLMKLDKADKVITFRPQSHLIQHHNKTVWFIHHLRTFYDLWDSSYRDFPADEIHKGIRRELMYLDTKALAEARAVYSNSKTVAARLKLYNNIDSQVLYPPLFDPKEFRFKAMNNEIVYISRLEHHKRQHLIIESMRWIPKPYTLRIVGQASNLEYFKYLEDIVQNNNLTDRVLLENRWVSEEEKVEILSQCWMNVYIPLDEDSYGYPTLEAAHSGKATLTLQDSGGVLEFVVDKVNGIVAKSDPKDIATRISEVIDLGIAESLGSSARERINELNINWDSVIERLLK